MGYTPPQLEVRKITGGWQIFPPDYTTTDDLTISANGTDTYAKILLEGDGNIRLAPKNGSVVYFVDGGTITGILSRVGNNFSLASNITDSDLVLSANGTGTIKFGTYTAGAATDSTGYITIKDAAGNTRKLMVQA